MKLIKARQRNIGTASKQKQRRNLQLNKYLMELEDNNKKLKASNDVLKERNEALEELLICYRTQKRPSEKLYRKLDKTKQALKEAGEL